MPILRLTFERMVDIAEPYRKKHDRIFGVECVGAEEIVERIRKTVSGI